MRGGVKSLVYAVADDLRRLSLHHAVIHLEGKYSFTPLMRDKD